MENMAIVSRNEITYLPIAWIRPNPYQPRCFFERDSIRDLAESIRQFGVLQPICVRMINSKSYEIIYGERRLRACKNLGIFYIPCVVADICDSDSAVVSLLENIQGNSLNFFEEAKGIYNIIEDYGYSIFETAKILGKKESYVRDKLQILKLPYEFQRDIIDSGLSEEFALAFSEIENEEILKRILIDVIKFDINIKKTKEIIDRVLKKFDFFGDNFDFCEIDDIIIKVLREVGEQKVKFFVGDMKVFTNTIYQAVEIMNKSGVATQCDVIENDKDFEFVIKVSTKSKNLSNNSMKQF